MANSVLEAITSKADSAVARDEKSTRDLISSDYSRTEREQFAVNIETRDLLKDLSHMQEKYLERFEAQIQLLDEISKTAKDHYDLAEQNS